MELDEIMRESDELNKRYSEILSLSDEEFLSEDITKELNYIRKRLLELCKEALNK